MRVFSEILCEAKTTCSSRIAIHKPATEPVCIIEVWLLLLRTCRVRCSKLDTNRSFSIDAFQNVGQDCIQSILAYQRYSRLGETEFHIPLHVRSFQKEKGN